VNDRAIRNSHSSRLETVRFIHICFEFRRALREH
jgi:hypothetical protein